MEESSVTVMKPYKQYDLKRCVIKVGTKTCPACVQSRESYEKFAAKYPKIAFYDVDSERFEREHSIQKVIQKCVNKTKLLPTFFYLRRGEIVAQMEGLSSSKMKKHLEAIS